MKTPPISRYAVMTLLSLALVVTGCQAGGFTKPDFISRIPIWRPKPRGEKEQPLPSPSAAQKLNVQMQFAAASEEKGDNEKAMQAYRAILEKNPHHGGACHRLAVLHDKQGDHKGAVAYYEKALAQRSDDAELLCDYGYSLYLQGRLDAAEHQLRAAIKNDGRLARAHANLGLVLARTGRADEALARFESAGCDRAEAHLNIAHALNWNKQSVEAEHHLRLAANEAPTSPAARTALAMLPHRADDSASSPPSSVSDWEEVEIRQTQFVANPTP